MPPDPPVDQQGGADPAGSLRRVESFLLGEAPSLTRREVAERSGVPVEVSDELWRLLGFPRAADDDVAFTPGDVEALRLTGELMALGVLNPERQSALVRTWGRSFARLAEWQTSLLADLAAEATESGESGESGRDVAELATSVLPTVERLQDYVWRRHLAGAAGRMMTGTSASAGEVGVVAVGFVDIVGFTSHSKELTEAELVAWIEGFEATCTDLVLAHGGRVIKSIGDAVLFVAEDLTGALEAALTITERGASADDTFPEVRAGVAYGEVVARLGDVFGPTVNIASRLTSLARPGSVLVDLGVHDALTGTSGAEEHPSDRHGDGPYELRRLRRTSVKGYSRLRSWVVRRRAGRRLDS